MHVLDLACDAEHRFEAWLPSHEAFAQQLAAGLLSCPVCGSQSLRKLLSAPRLNLSGQKADGSARQATTHQAHVELPSDHDLEARDGLNSDSASWPPAEIAEMAVRLAQQVRAVVDATEDVGYAFTQEARKMHYGETEQRAIRGQAQPEDVAAMQDEGIELLALPAWLVDKQRLS